MELLAQSRHHIWSLSDSNGIQTHNHLGTTQTFNDLAKLVKRPKWADKNLNDISITMCKPWWEPQTLALKKYFHFISLLIENTKLLNY